MPVTSEDIRLLLSKNPGQPIKLIDHFPAQELKDGKLYLDKVNFDCPSGIMHQINFENCVLTNCQFDGLFITKCNFSQATLGEGNTFHHALILADNTGLPSALSNQAVPLKAITSTLKRFVEEDKEVVEDSADSTSQTSSESASSESKETKETKETKVTSPPFYEEENSKAFHRFLWAHYPQYFSENTPLIEDQKGLRDGFTLYQEGFFHISHPDTAPLQKDYHLGWKLHLSVHLDDLIKAYRIAAPIITRYCHYFKAADLKSMSSKRIIDGCQITIYLEGDLIASNKKENKLETKSGAEHKVSVASELGQDSKSLHDSQIIYQPVTAEAASKMITAITHALKEANIRPGILPLSDAPTISLYFSLRNDSLKINNNFMDIYREQLAQFNSSFTEDDYILGDKVGSNYNPVNLPNPYQNLLTKTSAFNLSEHFASFPKEVPVIQRLNMTLVAYLRSYTNFDEADPSLTDKIRADAYDPGSDIRYFLKDKYRENNEITRAVKTTITILNQFLFSKADLLRVFPGFISCLYPCEDAFGDFLRRYDQEVIERYLLAASAQEKDIGSQQEDIDSEEDIDSQEKDSIDFDNSAFDLISEEYIRKAQLRFESQMGDVSASDEGEEIKKVQDILQQALKTNDHALYNLAVEKLKFHFRNNFIDFLKILENHHAHFFVQITLGPIYCASEVKYREYSDLKKGHAYLRRVIDQVDFPKEFGFELPLLETQPSTLEFIKELDRLTKRENPTALYMAALLHSQDVFDLQNERLFSGLSKITITSFSIDHQKSKAYLEKFIRVCTDYNAVTKAISHLQHLSKIIAAEKQLSALSFTSSESKDSKEDKKASSETKKEIKLSGYASGFFGTVPKEMIIRENLLSHALKSAQSAKEVLQNRDLVKLLNREDLKAIEEQYSKNQEIKMLFKLGKVG